MLKIYSKINPDLLLHMINRLEDVDGRTDIVPEDQFIQCATMKLEQGKNFQPHYHIKKERTYKEQIAQESWIVIQGSVKCYMYDIDNETILATSFTLEGAHTYEILEDDTIVYEYKTGPYEGQSLDKRYL